MLKEFLRLTTREGDPIIIATKRIVFMKDYEDETLVETDLPIGVINAYSQFVFVKETIDEIYAMMYGEEE